MLSVQSKSLSLSFRSLLSGAAQTVNSLSKTAPQTPSNETRPRLSSALQFLDPNRDAVLAQSERLMKAKYKILESYRRVKQALKAMQDHYLASKDIKNPIIRYRALDKMVKEVVDLERKYDWTLIFLPPMKMDEDPNQYVSLLMSSIEGRLQGHTTTISDCPTPQRMGIAALIGQAAAMSERAKEASRVEQLKTKPTDELRKITQQLNKDLFRICKKYLGLRTVLQQLRRDYDNSRLYPIIPRYSMLKTMIKENLRTTAFTNVCHENEE